jgi:hypothetical protein
MPTALVSGWRVAFRCGWFGTLYSLQEFAVAVGAAGRWRGRPGGRGSAESAVMIFSG